MYNYLTEKEVHKYHQESYQSDIIAYDDKDNMLWYMSDVCFGGVQYRMTTKDAYYISYVKYPYPDQHLGEEIIKMVSEEGMADGFEVSLDVFPLDTKRKKTGDLCFKVKHTKEQDGTLWMYLMSTLRMAQEDYNMPIWWWRLCEKYPEANRFTLWCLALSVCEKDEVGLFYKQYGHMVFPTHPRKYPKNFMEVKETLRSSSHPLKWERMSDAWPNYEVLTYTDYGMREVTDRLVAIAVSGKEMNINTKPIKGGQDF